MARLTKEERAALEAQLAEDDAADDDNDEVEIGSKDGGYFRGSWRRAQGVAAAWGIKLEADKPKDPPKDGDKKPARVSVLSPRRTGTGS